MSGGDKGDSCPVKKPATEKEILAKAPRGKADRIVVTGATGFVGKNLCKALVERGLQNPRPRAKR